MGTIRVVSFNVLHGRVADGGPVDLAVLADSAASLTADLLALQEVDVGVPRSGRADQARAVAAATGLSWVFGKAARVGGIGKYGNALLARGAFADVAVMALPKSGRRREPRSAILATVTMSAGGPPISVAATHLSIHRPEVHEQLHTVVAALAARPGPRLLIGDLNLPTAEVAPIVEATGLALVSTGGATFPRSSPRVRIDHVAVGGLMVGTVEVVATPSSDHCALAVEIEWP